MGATDIKRVQFVGSASLLCSAMSMPQEQADVTVMPAPDVTMVLDGEDEEVVNLEAIARLAMAKLAEDLAKAKTQNDEIAWKKEEWANRLAAAKKKKEDKEAVEAQRNSDKEAKKKVSVPPPVSFFCLSSSVVWKLTWFSVWAGCSAREHNSRAIQV